MDTDEQYNSDTTGSTCDDELEEQVILVEEPVKKKKSGRLFTEKARQALTTGRENYNNMRRERKLQNELILEEQRLERQQQYEENFVKKAISIKNREIRNRCIDLIEDDNTSPEQIHKMKCLLNEIPRVQTQIPQVQTQRNPFNIPPYQNAFNIQRPYNTIQGFSFA